MRQDDREVVEIDVTVKHITPKAILVFNGSKEVWIPRSMISDWSPNTDEETEITSIFIPEWLATEKGLT